MKRMWNHWNMCLKSKVWKKIEADFHFLRRPISRGDLFFPLCAGGIV